MSLALFLLLEGGAYDCCLFVQRHWIYLMRGYFQGVLFSGDNDIYTCQLDQNAFHYVPFSEAGQTQKNHCWLQHESFQSPLFEIHKITRLTSSRQDIFGGINNNVDTEVHNYSINAHNGVSCGIFCLVLLQEHKPRFTLQIISKPFLLVTLKWFRHRSLY